MSNQMLDIIKTRRSIRKYKPDQISEKELDAVLEAGTYAPTGKASQSPVIVAVQNKEAIKKLTAMNAEVWGVSFDPYFGAPTIVLVFADSEKTTPVENGSCVLQNMMLAAHSLGLGSCWVNRERQMFETAEGKALMKEWGLEDSLIGIGALSLGYVDGDIPDAAPRKDDYIVKVV